MTRFWRRNAWWLTRVLLLPVSLLAFAIVSFLLVRSIPGDPVLHVLGPNYTQEAYDAMQAELGLDGPLIAQLGAYLAELATGSLGTSISTGAPVLEEFLARLPPTLELATLGLVSTLVVTAVLGYVAVFRPRWLLSRIVVWYARAAGAIPEYVFAIAGLFVFYTVLGWAPAPVGRIDSSISTPPTVTGFPLLDAAMSGSWPAVVSILQHYVLPIVVLVLANAPILLKILIAGLEEGVSAAPTRFRIASGATHGAVVASMFRRAAPPVITMSGTLFGYLLGGAVILETLFGFVGVGQYVVAAVNVNDVIAIQGFLMAVAALTMIVFLAVDIITMVVDPRRRAGASVEGA
ncbi:ABC transporter permease [Agromyces sp. SYSU T00194]|uniref:ABC transporter permease n=1 Tax=Agromyces chitinivorans TaxID=3158560 RepID=UPI00339A18F8